MQEGAGKVQEGAGCSGPSPSDLHDTRPSPALTGQQQPPPGLIGLPRPAVQALTQTCSLPVAIQRQLRRQGAPTLSLRFLGRRPPDSRCLHFRPLGAPRASIRRAVERRIVDGPGRGASGRDNRRLSTLLCKPFVVREDRRDQWAPRGGGNVLGRWRMLPRGECSPSLYLCPQLTLRLTPMHL